ncbi:hypothetical protein DRA42_06545 [Ethanoligenens harbinense]|nr:hypothetical protein CXQ68_06520 [Ethanoligenens harbinense YUAN-3]AYF38578.1 hypothetical protein CXP51_06390 [Ethanoligenens harbinense]QCN92157.1 hypothetical protein DRA42_06545 [Ethanoligenens harbinense]
MPTAWLTAFFRIRHEAVMLFLLVPKFFSIDYVFTNRAIELSWENIGLNIVAFSEPYITC